MKIQVSLVILMLLYYVAPLEGYGESDGAGHPNYQERLSQVFINAVRLCKYLCYLV